MKNKIIIIFILVLSIFFFYKNNNVLHCMESSEHEAKVNKIEVKDLHTEYAATEQAVKTNESAMTEHKSQEIANSSSEQHSVVQENHNEHSGDKGSEGTQKEENAEHNQHTGIHDAPLEYYIMWSFIVLIIVILFGYYMKFISVKGFFGSRIAEDDLEHEQDIETSGFALLIVIFAVIFYSLLMLPEIFGYFDAQTHSFINGYHESNFIGFLRFVAVTVTGIMMTIYAFLGMRHH